jgi:hypothetical protein
VFDRKLDSIGEYHEQVESKKNKSNSPPSDLRLFSSENCLTIFKLLKAIEV